MNAEKAQIEISIARQCLRWRDTDGAVREYRISTARNGAGERRDSGCTPRGRHVIADKIGDECAPNTVFVGRVPTGERFTTELRGRHPERDWILTRILRLRGDEPGVNRGGDVDSWDRYIYIHGAPDDIEMGVAGSAGCIRMRNADVIELFDAVSVGTVVNISE